MCGIAGIVSPNASLVQLQRLQCMAESLKHRGPEGEKFWIDTKQQVGFAHRRLCIIDLSEQAAQPLHYRHYTIIFNGEIYNYIELKEELKKKDIIFLRSQIQKLFPLLMIAGMSTALISLTECSLLHYGMMKKNDC